MGPHRTAALIALWALAAPAWAQAPGWGFSPLPGEGDRAAMGCDRDATKSEFTCLAVRCEDDFTAGVHLYSSRPGGGAGPWEMTVDRENFRFTAEADAGPYGARFLADGDTLLERLRLGTFIYLRHAGDDEAPFAFISLAGSMTAITEALYWCAPRVPPGEQNAAPDVGASNPNKEKPNEPSSARPQ